MPVTVSARHLPRDDLRCHLILGVAIVPCETEISEFKLAICGNEQVVGFEILRPALKNLSQDICEIDTPDEAQSACDRTRAREES